MSSRGVRAHTRILSKSKLPAKSRSASPARRSSVRRPSAKSTVALLREVAAFAEAAPVLGAITAQSCAYERFDRACDRIDNVAADQEGRVVTDADKAEWSEADAAEVKSLKQLVRTRPATVEGLRALIQYSGCCFRRQGWDDATMAQLLTSILRSAPLRSRLKAAYLSPLSRAKETGIVANR